MALALILQEPIVKFDIVLVLALPAPSVHGLCDGGMKASLIPVPRVPLRSD